MCLFQSSTCFEQTRAHHQEVNCISTLCKWPSGMLNLHTGRPFTESDYTRCCINTTDPLMMSTCLLETCRGLKWTYYMKELCVKLVTYQKFCLIYCILWHLLSISYPLPEFFYHFYCSWIRFYCHIKVWASYLSYFQTVQTFLSLIWLYTENSECKFY